jgi:UrcA family protein
MENQVMKTLAKTALHSLVALGLAGTAAAPAFAQDFDRMIVSVPYGDLDLATPEGQKALDRRVEKAVRTVCRTGRFDGGGTRLMTQDAVNCLAKARLEAKQKVAAIIENEQRGG